jgi:glycosyltransferase involved in cell wall biosynthesis
VALEALAKKEGVSNRVDFMGFLPDRESVYQEMARAGVFVFPSKGEGFCVAVAEAMAVGLPVVVSDIPVFHEVVGDAGIYVDHSSPRAIAESVAALRDDPEHTKSLGRRNYQRVHSKFTLQKTAHGYADAYRQVCANRLTLS